MTAFWKGKQKLGGQDLGAGPTDPTEARVLLRLNLLSTTQGPSLMTSQQTEVGGRCIKLERALSQAIDPEEMATAFQNLSASQLSISWNLRHCVSV